MYGEVVSIIKLLCGVGLWVFRKDYIGCLLEIGVFKRFEGLFVVYIGVCLRFSFYERLVIVEGFLGWYWDVIYDEFFMGFDCVFLCWIEFVFYSIVGCILFLV